MTITKIPFTTNYSLTNKTANKTDKTPLYGSKSDSLHLKHTAKNLSFGSDNSIDDNELKKMTEIENKILTVVPREELKEFLSFHTKKAVKEYEKKIYEYDHPSEETKELHGRTVQT